MSFVRCCVVALAFVVPCAAVAAVSHRALVVGINAYGGGLGASTGGRQFGPLKGAVADAEAFAAVLRKNSFDVVLLTDANATRQAILDGIGALARGAGPGDVRVFYFAGHGSRVRNSLAPELDKLDESLLPVDVGQVKGGVEVRDIRDKELARALNEIIDRDAVLTVVLDSCHSGSATRGENIEVVGKARRAPWDERDVKDASRPPPPETRGALVMAAAQDEEVAQETGAPTRGVFTKALVEALQEPGALHVPARGLFLSVEAAVRRQSKERQVPVLAGSAQRQRTTVFGAGQAKPWARMQVRIRRRGEAFVAETQPILRLGAGSLLEQVTAKGSVRLEVSQTMPGAELVLVRPVRPGDAAAISDGRWARVVQWVPPSVNLRVHVPSPAVESQLALAKKAMERLRQSGVFLVQHPIDDAPTHRLEALPRSDGIEWFVAGPCVKAGAEARGRDARALLESAISRVTVGCPSLLAEARVFVSLPPTPALVGRLEKAWRADGSPIDIVPRFGDASYVLVGRAEKEGIAYAFAKNTKAPAAMPPITDFVPASGWLPPPEPSQQELSDVDAKPVPQDEALLDFGTRLGRTYDWLSLSGTDPKEQAAFAYELLLKPENGSDLRSDGERTREGEQLGLVLRLVGHPKHVPRRYVYVYSMDVRGRRQLVYPPPELGDVENLWPLESARPDDKIVLLEGERAFTVGPPLGTDTYFLYAATRKLEDPLALEDTGVRTRSLIFPTVEAALRGYSARGTEVPGESRPLEWTFKKISVTSTK